MEIESVDVNGERIVFFVQRKKIKNIILKVKPDKKVILSVPNKMKLEVAKEFVKKKADWIRKQQNYYESFAEKKENIIFENGDTVYLLGKQYKMKIIPNKINNIMINGEYFEINIKEKYIENKKYIKKVYDKWLKEYAEQILNDLIIKYQSVLEKYNIKIPKMEIRQMKSRWGSCIPLKNKVIFNLNLIKTPMCCIEYVVLHELSHFKYQNHSKNFYNFISISMPDWKERKKILNKEFMWVV